MEEQQRIAAELHELSHKYNVALASPAYPPHSQLRYARPLRYEKLQRSHHELMEQHDQATAALDRAQKSGASVASQDIQQYQRSFVNHALPPLTDLSPQ